MSAGFVVAIALRAALAAADPAPAIDYDRQIRPILSNTCFKCHGPDAEERESGLRLDIRDEALKPAESGKPAIVPGKPDESRLLTMIASRKTPMPPKKTGKSLSDSEK